jgi:hypothetical protein
VKLNLSGPVCQNKKQLKKEEETCHGKKKKLKQSPFYHQKKLKEKKKSTITIIQTVSITGVALINLH